MRNLEIILFFIAVSTTVQGQSIDQPFHEFDVDLFVGLGPSLPASEELTYNFALDYESAIGIVQFRVSGINEGIRLFSDSPPETTTDLSVLYGIKVYEIENQEDAEFSFRVLAGIGYTTIITKGELISPSGENIFGTNKYEKVKEAAIGFPFEIGMKNQANSIGVKLVLVGNINKKDSYAGVVGGFFVELF